MIGLIAVPRSGMDGDNIMILACGHSVGSWIGDLTGVCRSSDGTIHAARDNETEPLAFRCTEDGSQLVVDVVTRRTP
jgi:hypothetical protein